MEKKENEKQKELDREDSQNGQICEMGQVMLEGNSRKHKVELLTVIGEIEGHESAPSNSKTTKYEHVLPKLALIEDDEEIEGASGPFEYSGWGRGSRAGYCGDDCLFKYSYGFPGSGRRTFHWCSAGCFRRLFLYCAKRDYGGSSCTPEWNVYRCSTDIP